MISLGPLNDTKKVKAYFNDKNLSYNENSGCVLCSCNGEVLGFCLFDLDNEKIVVKYIEPLNDLSLADGILRSTLHVAAEKSIMNAFYDDTLDEAFLKKIGFIKNSEEKRLDIDKLFKSCCSCNNN